MTYVYETHCHTNVVSACGKISPEKLVDLYVKNGFTGVFITEHFLNGNCVKAIKEQTDYAEKIRMYFEGYKKVKEIANGRLDVFFGVEVSYLGTDVLVYGLTEQDYLNHPEIMDLSMRDFIRFANSMGALTIQAHPFREANYIDHIRLYTEVQGVEVYNSSRDKLCNKLAKDYYNAYNKEYKKIKTAGSDLHTSSIKTLGGMAFNEKLKSTEDFILKLKLGKGKIIKKENVLY